MKAEFAYPPEVVEIWFSYLRLAHEVADTDLEIKRALKGSNRFYKPWGDVTKVSFKKWWKYHSDLFEENDVIQLIRYPNPVPLPRKDRLLLSISLTRSPTELAAMVLEIFKKNSKTVSSKSKKRPTSKYTLTEGTEIKSKGPVPLLDKLILYRFRFLNPMSDSELLGKVKEIYDEQGRSVPDTFKNGPKESRLRSLRRYLTDAKQVTINVANGEFPGRRSKTIRGFEA